MNSFLKDVFIFSMLSTKYIWVHISWDSGYGTKEDFKYNLNAFDQNDRTVAKVIVMMAEVCDPLLMPIFMLFHQHKHLGNG